MNNNENSLEDNDLDVKVRFVH